ncbi:MAG: hypothetical protein WKG03_19865, partial [Telluria sp.]
EGLNIPMLAGYPDVGGDGFAQAATATAASGIAIAAGLTDGDYVLATTDPASVAPTPPATATFFTVTADAAHPRCRFTYVEGSQTAPASGGGNPVATAPRFITTDLIAANCN